MLKKLERIWPFFSILLLLVILASLFLLPKATRLLSLLAMGLGLAAIIAFSVGKQVRACRAGKITRPALIRNIIVDVSGILITMAVVILISSKVTALAAQAAGKAWGVTAGILSALGAGLAVGFGVGSLVGWGWGKLTKPGRFARTERLAGR